MRSFLGFGQVPYIGQPQAQSMKLAGIAGVGVPLLFQWISYGALSKTNINVLVDISQQPCVKLDQIRSVYIDNLGSNNPIYVNFPDTNYTVVAKPNSEGWYPAYTNKRQCWVIGEGFLAGDLPQTWIILSNIFLAPSVNVEIDQAKNLELASPSISRGTTIYNSALGSPALGDQFFASAIMSVVTAGAVANMWNSPYASGFLYVTSLAINLLNAITAGSAGINGSIAIESSGAAGILIQPWYFVQGADFEVSSVTGVQTILNLTDLQIKLDATQSWRVRVIVGTALTGFCQIFSTFTQVP